MERRNVNSATAMRVSKIGQHAPVMLFSLFSVDPGQEREFASKLDGSFEDYLSKLENITCRHFECKNGRPPTNDEKQFASLYQPRLYLALGEFDIAGLCLIDDFELIHKLSLVPRQHAQQFFVGMLPVGEGFESQSGRELEILRTDFRQRFPLLAISQLKISPLWTSILGFELVEALLYACRKRLDKLELRSNNSVNLILHSQAWSEILLLVFSRSVTEIADTILDLRERDLCSMFEDKAFDDTINKIKQSSFAKILLKSEGPGDILKSHVFATSYTTFGFNFEIFDGLYAKYAPKQEESENEVKEKFDLAVNHLSNLSEESLTACITNLCCRPGHLSKVHEQAEDALGNSELAVLIGKQDYMPLRCADGLNRKPGNVADCIKRIVDLEAKVLEEPQKKPHVFKTRTSWVLSPSLSIPAVHTDHIYGFRPLATPNPDWAKLVKDARAKVRSIGIPKNLVFEIDRIFSTFDMCIRNFQVIDAFADLCPLVNRMARLLAEVENYGGGIVLRQHGREISLPEFVRGLQTCVEAFKGAFSNRYLQSYATNEVNDFAFEFRGSIHQIVSAVSGFSNTLLDLLDKKEMRSSLVIVGSSPRVCTSPNFIGCPIFFNYHLLFEPMELAAAYHEVGHYLVMTDWHDIKEDLPSEKRYAHSAEEIFCAMLCFRFGFLGDWELFAKFYWSRFHQWKQMLGGSDLVQSEFEAHAVRYLLATSPTFVRDLRSHTNALRAINKCRDKLQIAKGFEPFIEVMLNQSSASGRPLWDKVYHESEMMIEKSHPFFEKVEYALAEKLTKLDLGVRISDEFKLPATHKQDIDQLRRSLSCGESLILDLEELNSEYGAFRFAQKILYAYLCEAFKNVDPDYPYIIRKEGKIEFRGNGSLFVDPAGGSFVSGYKFRSTYLELRIAALMSLFDLAQKRKREFIEDQLK